MFPRVRGTVNILRVPSLAWAFGVAIWTRAGRIIPAPKSRDFSLWICVLVSPFVPFQKLIVSKIERRLFVVLNYILLINNETSICADWNTFIKIIPMFVKILSRKRSISFAIYVTHKHIRIIKSRWMGTNVFYTSCTACEQRQPHKPFTN